VVPLLVAEGHQVTALTRKPDRTATLRALGAVASSPRADACPPRRSLAHTYALGRDSVRKALRLLREAGLVESVQGRRTFVTRRNQGGPGGRAGVGVRRRGQPDQMIEYTWTTLAASSTT
jgi:DNA-binding FadR family transcriptional regulator